MTNTNAQLKDHCLVCAGALAGGLVGFYAFMWLVRSGFYALVLPGALAGFGAGLFRNHSRSLAVLCGMFGLALGIVAEWRVAPFIANREFGYFLSHLHQLKGFTMILILVGGLFAFWVPFRRVRRNAAPPE